MFGTIDSWLVFNLSGEHVTDPSNASRTLLYDIGRGAWDDELLRPLRRAARGRCPRCGRRSATFGTTRPDALHGHDGPGRRHRRRPAGGALRPGLPGPGAGQEHLRHGLVRAAQQRRGRRRSPPPGLLATVAWAGSAHRRTQYALEASIFVTGAAVQWLRDGLGIIREAAETEALAASLESNDGVYFVPALTGLGSPHWDPYARGTIVGLTRGSGRAHLARATLEAIAYQTLDAVRAMEQASGRELRELKADGGATANGWLMQFQADVLGVPVVVPEVARDDRARRGAAGRRRRGPVDAGPRRRSCGASARATSRRWAATSATRCSDGWREAVALARAWAG